MRNIIIYILIFFNSVLIVRSQNLTSPQFLKNNSISWVDSVMSNLTVEEKIAQLIMVAAYSNKESSHENNIEKLITEYKIGGLIFMQGGPVRQAILTNRYQTASKVPLMIAIDGEWGLAMRLDSTVKFPRQMMLGAIQDNNLVYEMGKEIARQCKAMGIQINFAPVIDVNNNSKNPVINNRSFGENKVNVADKGIAYMKGMQDNNILATGKHFPGHGDTNADSHYALPVIKHSYERIDSLELFPFKKLISEGLGSIMTAHLNIPALDSSKNIAASISPKIVQSLLKDSLDFKGLIFTDALNMKGVSDYNEAGKVDLLAFMAGNDVLLFSGNVPKAISEIKLALDSNMISLEQLNEKCRKILMFKYWSGLDKKQIINTSNLINNLNSNSANKINHLLVKNSLTVLKNDSNLIPIKNLDKNKIASVVLNLNDDNIFQQYLSLYSKIDNYYFPKNFSSSKVNELIDTLYKYDIVIITMLNSNNSVSKNYNVTKDYIDFIKKVSSKTNVILTLLANPYSLNAFGNIDNIKSIIVGYEDMDLTQMYSAQLIFGGIPSLGKLPVSASIFKVGDGIIIDNQYRIQYTLPELAGVNPEKLYKIDSIALNGIAEGAYPGCQILIAKNGKVFYQKSFGYHTYNSKKYPVKNTDLYDLASISKLASTTMVLMNMYENNNIDINKTLGDYLPYLDSSDKKGLVIKDVLSHQSRLAAWIPFWQKTVVDKKLREDIYSSEFSEEFPVKVAENVYIKKEYYDSLYLRIRDSKLLDKKEYKYSDLGFFLFHRLIERNKGVKLDKLADSLFYSKLGAYTLGYKPLEKFEKNVIIPTQEDNEFRKQLVHGYVHDPGAAMIGGVAGHAGLFSNANDLAKLMQMLLDKGEYGGERYLKSETIDYFNTCHFCKNDNRRGLGFDKPELNTTKPNPVCKSASANSFGHTGFTGTIAWVDPDSKLVYIFLSNRIHTDQENRKLIKMNIREKIQETIYQSFQK